MRRAGAVVAALALTAIGCQSPDRDHSATTRPAFATDTDPQRAEAAYWLDQTPSLAVAGNDFDRLWDASIAVSEDYLFAIDRRDRRQGLLTTAPMVSAQWFEPWRRELQTAHDVAESSTATIRRTIYWNFTRTGDRFDVVPKVLIERQSLNEERISGLLSRAYFSRQGTTDKIYGTRETDQNVLLPANYYYPIGRDFAFEQKLVEKLRERLAAPL